jgi:two-component system KDP operon response regulator KdpE
MNESVGGVLLVDDDAAIRQALRTTLSSLGFAVQQASNGEEAIATLRTNQFDAILLDVNMPGMGGLDACRKIRNLLPTLPILMLTVRDSQDDIVQALDAGADDYIAKPFHIRELIARLKVAIRRNRSTDIPKVLTQGEIELDPNRRAVRKSGRRIHLTPKEFDLLQYLMQHAGMPIAYAKILRVVWGADASNEIEYLRTYMRQLRVKLEVDPSQPVYLLTEANIGYKFCVPVFRTG